MKIVIYIFFFFATVNIMLSDYYDINIPTRVDETGKKYLAADLHSKDTTMAKPVILIQTPYNKFHYRLLDLFPAQSGRFGFEYDLDNYNIVIIDWRGFYASKGATINNYDRGLDGYDAVEWIASQKWCNGKVGTCGGSALGQIQFLTARRQPPHLVCAVPSIKDYKTQYSNYFYGGVYRKEHTESLEGLGFMLPGAILAVHKYSLLWERAADSTDYPEDFNIPMLLISGWFDHYPADILRAFYDIRTRSNINFRNIHKLIFGPWSHSEVGQKKQGELEFPEAEGYATDATMRFFGRYLLGNKNNWEGEPVIRYFMMGDNKWQTTEDWYTVKKAEVMLYLHPQGKLQFEPVPVTFKEVEPDTIVYNPKDPSPSDGGSRFNPLDSTIRTGPYDIRNTVENRNDILIYETESLASDLRVTGSIEIVLFFASDRTDTDIAARLCDVYPDGRSIILTQGIQRLRYRNSLKKEELLTPGELVQVKVILEHLGHTFKTGHKLRIDLTGADYPMFDINLNNGGELYKPGDTLIAKNLIYHDNGNQSRIVIPTDMPLSIEESKIYDNSEFELSPNPASDYIEFNIERFTPSGGWSATDKIRIFNILGECVLVGTLQATYQRIDVSKLSQGIYYLNLKSNQLNLTKQFIILR